LAAAKEMLLKMYEYLVKFIPQPSGKNLLKNGVAEQYSQRSCKTRKFRPTVWTPCLKKLCKNYVCYKFVKSPPTVKIFGKKMAKRINLCEVHCTLSTSPNLWQRNALPC